MTNLSDPDDLRDFDRGSNHSNQSFGVFIKCVDDLGIEYYTEPLTGRSGMSHIGLARFVGTSQPAITKWVRKISASDPITCDLPECFKPFAGKVFHLITSNGFEGAEILSDEFCAAVAAYYAAYAPAKNQTPEAKMALLITSSMGLRSHIQSRTGWKQPQPDQAQLPPNQTQLLQNLDRRLEKLESALETHRPSKSKKGKKRHDPPSQKITDLILEAIATSPHQTSEQIAKRVGMSTSYVRRTLTDMKRKKLLERSRPSSRQRHLQPWQYSLPASPIPNSLPTLPPNLAAQLAGENSQLFWVLQQAEIAIRDHIAHLDFPSRALMESCLELFDDLEANAGDLCEECWLLVQKQLIYRMPIGAVWEGI